MNMSAVTYYNRPATADEILATAEHLKAHTEASIGVKVEFEPFAVTAYRGETLIGSIIGKIYSGWMHMELVWVDESCRRQGIGRSLLQHAISDATARGLKGIEVWTQSWQAPEFYLSCGFTTYVILDDFLPGKKRHVLHYRLGEAT